MEVAGFQQLQEDGAGFSDGCRHHASRAERLHGHERPRGDAWAEIKLVGGNVGEREKMAARRDTLRLSNAISRRFRRLVSSVEDNEWKRHVSRV